MFEEWARDVHFKDGTGLFDEIHETLGPDSDRIYL